jgi:hypothetical protein
LSVAAIIARTWPVHVRREEVDEAVDGLGRVGGMHGGEDEVTRLGRAQGGVDRLLVAHLADEDDVGVLAQDAPQGARERARVHPDLALVDQRALVGVQDLERVLDRDDVTGARGVDVVDHRRERRRLARSRRAGEQEDAALRSSSISPGARGVLGRQRVDAVDDVHVAVEADGRRRRHLEVQVRAAPLDEVAQAGVQIEGHRPPRSAGGRALLSAAGPGRDERRGAPAQGAPRAAARPRRAASAPRPATAAS